ncbi:MAG: hypothetical protein H7A23_05315 [Leptospiraceae bacterium]|nr:hypothetical protein [Leptospiraceae bacterium]MCP5493955.1 hypothetical protein [Leptospiraceae bacterium]
MGNNGKSSNNHNDEYDLESDDIENFLQDDSISIINIKSGKKFLKWVKKIQKEKNVPIEYTDEEILEEVESFHVPSFTDEESVKDFFNDYGEDIFTYMFATFYKDRSVIPPYHGVDSLYDYFEITVDDYIKSFEEILDFLEGIDDKTD